MTVVISGTSGISGTNGSAGTPAVQGEDTNTGIFFPAADTVAVATGGAERLRVDSSGNAGLGTTSVASGKLNVVQGTSSALTVLSQSSTVGDGATSNTAIRSTNLTGTSWANTRYDAYTHTWGIGGSASSNSAMTLDASGNLLVGTTGSSASPAVGCQLISGGNGQLSVGHDSGASSGFFYASFARSSVVIGSITQNGTTGVSYNTSSDYRLKENVAPMQNALDTVAQLNPVTYTWKADGSAGQGFIAHELQAVVPDCVTGEKDAVDAEGNPQYQGVDTSFLVATLVAAIKEQQATITAFETRLAALEAQ